jgi:glyoxylase-like metal-dependent hydrolase (beta-lactamase superfamily II)
MDGSNGALRFPLTTAPRPGEVQGVTPGVWWLRMPLPFALDHINLWLIEDGPGWTVVDAGYALPQTRAAWERIFAEHLGGRPANRVVVTHYHPDHVGLAGWLCERWQAPLSMTEKEWLFARVMSRGSDDLAQARCAFARRAGLDAAASDVFGGREKSYRRGVPTVPPTFARLADGMDIAIGGRRWHVIIGEGHAPEHACLYCAELGVLIAGDQVLPKISPNISVQAHEPAGNPLQQYLVSLARLRAALPAETLVLPSHNLPFFGLHTRIDELASHHAARCEALLGALSERPKNAVELLPVLFRRPLDAHQTAFALGEALAHLHYLEARGEVCRSQATDGVDYFARSGG